MRKPICMGILAVLAVGFWSAALAAEHDEAWVAEQVKKIKQSDTTGWASIPWVASLTEARRVSGEEKKPVFLFTLDGNIETGRC
jgi:hypothetical protein